MEWILNLIIINFVINYLYNFTTIIEDFRIFVSEKIGKEVKYNKLFRCSGCLTFWISIIYLIITGPIGLWYIIPVGIFNHMLVGPIVGITSLVLTLLNKIKEL